MSSLIEQRRLNDPTGSFAGQAPSAQAPQSIRASRRNVAAEALTFLAQPSLVRVSVGGDLPMTKRRSEPAPPENGAGQLSEIDAELATMIESRAAILVSIAELDAEQKALPPHPNNAAYTHGGILTGAGMGAAHILAVAGLFAEPWHKVLNRLTNVAPDAVGASNLLRCVQDVCESDAELEHKGLAWLSEQGLLQKGVVNPFWLKRPKLGLGQAAKFHGLKAEHRDGHRGLYTLAVGDLRRRFQNAVVNQSDDGFGSLLLPMIVAGGSALAERGALASHLTAKARYEDDCRSFADHQRSTNDRSWRWKPPLSRQGHLAVTTAAARGVAVPAERTRGHAANWLEDNDANPRFKEAD